MFHHLAQVHSHFCRIPNYPSRIGQTVEQPISKTTQPKSKQMDLPVLPAASMQKGPKMAKKITPKIAKNRPMIFLLLNCVPGRRPSKPPPRPSRSSVSGPRPSPLSRPPSPPPRCPRRCFPSPGAQFKRQNFSFIFSLNIGLSFGLRFPSLEKGQKRVEFVVSLDT